MNLEIPYPRESTQEIYIHKGKYCFILSLEYSNLRIEQKRHIIETLFNPSMIQDSLTYLKESPEQELTQEQLFFLGLHRTLRTIEQRRKRGYGSSLSENFPGQIRIKEQDIWFASSIELAKRGANSFKEDLLMFPDGAYSRFGLFRTISAENNLWSDHGRDHFRRVERYIDDQISMIDGFRTSATEQWLNGLYLFPEWHDVAQILRYQRNALREQQRLLPYHVKVGHELEAVIVALTLVPEYARSRGITEDEARKQIAAFAFLCMGHDEKRETYEQAIQSIDPARTDEPIESLYRRYKNGTIDRRTLSYRQIFALYRHELQTFFADKKKSQGYANILEETRFGLDPDFEQEYANRLETLSQSDETLFPVNQYGSVAMDHESFLALQQTAMIALRADRIEYLSPGFQAIVRKLLNQYSQKRLLFGGEKEELYECAKQRGFEKTIDQTSLSELKLFLATCGEPNFQPSIDSDTLRSAFELFDIPEEHDPYLQRISQDSAILYAITFKEIIPLLMRPNKQAIEQIDEFFIQEAISIGKKLAKKYNISINITDESHTHAVRSIQETLSQYPEANTIYRNNLARLEETRHELYRRVSGKPKRKNRERRILELSSLFSHEENNTTHYEFELYSMQEVLSFKLIMRKVIQELQRRFRVSRQDLSEYYRLFNDKKNPQTVPYETYYGTNHDLRKARRIVKRHPLIEYIFTSISQE